MTSNERVEVIQADRDVASALVRSGAPGLSNGNKIIADEIKGGRHDDWFVVQEVAHHRVRHTPAPAADAVEAVRLAIEKHICVSPIIEDGAVSGWKVFPPSISLAARAAISAYDRSSGVERLREALEGVTDLASGPDGRGTMRVVASGFPPGKEGALFSLLNDALSSLKESGR